MRHWVLVTYDISSDKRWRKIHTLMQDYGQPIQYSVFMCQLTAIDEVRLMEAARDLIDPSEDQLILVRLQPAGKSLAGKLQSIGRPLVSLDLKRLQF